MADLDDQNQTHHNFVRKAALLLSHYGFHLRQLNEPYINNAMEIIMDQNIPQTSLGTRPHTSLEDDPNPFHFPGNKENL
jgi:hypothetical protein